MSAHCCNIGIRVQYPGTTLGHMHFYFSLAADLSDSASSQPHYDQYRHCKVLCLQNAVMDAVWRCLYDSYNGIVVSFGNEYSIGSRTVHDNSAQTGKSHDQAMPLSAVKYAEVKPQETKQLLAEKSVSIEKSNEAEEDEE